jgi:hypothetical protein
MELKPGNYCPLLKKDCIGIQCAWFTQMIGKNPNTGQDINEWNCAITWLPVLLIENSQQSRQTAAAVESFRNEMVNQGNSTQQMFLNMVNQSQKLIEG